MIIQKGKASMFGRNLKIATTEVARVMATAQCMLEGRGKLVHLPSPDEGDPGAAVWSGLITQLLGSRGPRQTQTTSVYYITGVTYTTSLSLQETMALLA